MCTELKSNSLYFFVFRFFFSKTTYYLTGQFCQKLSFGSSSSSSSSSSIYFTISVLAVLSIDYIALCQAPCCYPVEDKRVVGLGVVSVSSKYVW